MLFLFRPNLVIEGPAQVLTLIEELLKWTPKVFSPSGCYDAEHTRTSSPRQASDGRPQQNIKYLVGRVVRRHAARLAFLATRQDLRLDISL